MLRQLALCLALALSLSWLQPAVAARAQDRACDQACATELQRSGQILSLSEVIVRAGIIRRGQLLGQQLFERNGQYIYGFRLLDEGNNRTFGVCVNARTGAVVSCQ